jgi:heat shock protein HslJ
LEIEFGADGRVSGFAGVNQFNGMYELTPGAANRGGLHIGPLAVTKMAGPENLMKQEATYLEALGRVDGYVAEGGLLELEAGGEPLLRYRTLATATAPAGQARGAGPGR